jgi:hypothetical protein
MIRQADSGDPALAGRTPILGESPLLSDAVRALWQDRAELMQEQLSGIHNPWGAAAALTDPWRFLEVCESPEMVDRARRVLGDDIILWDSELYLRARDYASFAPLDAEGRYWPVDPLVGAVAVLDISEGAEILACVEHAEIVRAVEALAMVDAPLLVVRLMSATSHFVRDPGFPANRICMKEQALINYTNRPLWLISGKNTGDSDLVTGFAPPVPAWAGSASTKAPKEENKHAIRDR